MKTIKLLAVLGIIGVLFVSGCSSKKDAAEPDKSKETVTVADDTVWTCSMHPEIEESKPGVCSKCNMKLIEKK
jgi:Cu(I)/Ag(I) efflux system membrane fusion protein